MQLQLLIKWVTYTLSGGLLLFFALLLASIGTLFWVERDVSVGGTAANVERVRFGMNATQVMGCSDARTMCTLIRAAVRTV